jgi:hypothetical protein
MDTFEDCPNMSLLYSFIPTSKTGFQFSFYSFPTPHCLSKFALPWGSLVKLHPLSIIFLGNLMSCMGEAWVNCTKNLSLSGKLDIILPEGGAHGCLHTMKITKSQKKER